MHTVLFNESFSFCARDDLERLQPVSQSLLDMVVGGSNVLPLRPIQSVAMQCHEPDGKFRIVVEADKCVYERDYEASAHDGDFAEIFRRLQHTCIKYFHVGIPDSPFPRYWRAQEAAAFTVVDIDFDLSETTDYDVFDSLVNHLRPKTMQVDVSKAAWHEDGYYSEKLLLLARDSFLDSLKFCYFQIFADVFPAPAFFLKHPGYPNYVLSCVDNCQAADGIDGFIESFLRDGCPNKKLESVLIMWHDPRDQQLPAPKQLSKSTKIDMPLLEDDMTAWITPGVHQVSQCEMQVFVNAKQWKRMKVYKWSVGYIVGCSRHTTHILQCRVENL